MENEFIPYEQALALKELGFDEPCLAFYWITGKFYIASEHHNCVGFHKQNQLGDYNYDSISAPLYQQAFRWFRKEYDLHENIGIKHFVEKTYCYNIVDISVPHYIHDTSHFLSYREAELECLKKLIEIVKNK